MKQGELLFLLLFILFLGGCSQKSLQADDTSTQTDNLLRVSEWEETGIDLRGKLNLKMIRDTLFYIDEEWETHEDAKTVTGTSVYRKKKTQIEQFLQILQAPD